MTSRPFQLGDTIVAPATALGGPVAVVRVSGPDASVLARKHLEAATVVSHRMRYGWMKGSAGEVLDEVLWVLFLGPRSFTGEDVLEIHTHGSPMIVDATVRALCASGARHAEPGEFSYRAVLNGRMSAEEAEGVAALIAARDELGHRRALAKRRGEDLAWFAARHQEISKALAATELLIDFSDQGLDDVEEGGLEAVRLALAGPRAGLEELLRISTTKAQKSGRPVFLVGAPNAGKSSLFNAFLGEERALVSPQPGTTRDVVSETLRNARGGWLRLFDTAGLRETAEEIERAGIARLKEVLEKERDAHPVVVWVFDPTQHAQAQLRHWDELPVPPTIGVLAKRDLWDAQAVERADEISARFPSLRWIHTSAMDRAGLKALDEAIQSADSTGAVSSEVGSHLPLVARDEQCAALAAAVEALRRAQRDAAGVADAALVANSLREALRNLEPLFGEVTADDILRKIFAEFCIGK